MVEPSAIDLQSGLTGATAFAALLLAGNVVNSFAEEGVFRGVLLPLFRRQLDPWPALGFSALLFGAWHLPWAVKAIRGAADGAPPGISWAAATSFLPQAALGVVWGYLYLRTGNLWGAWAAHTLTNSALNFVHIRSSEGLNTGMTLGTTIFTTLMLAGMAVIYGASERYRLPHVQP